MFTKAIKCPPCAGRYIARHVCSEHCLTAVNMQEVARLDRRVLCDHIMKGIDCCMIRCLLLKQMKTKIFLLYNRGYALNETYLIMYSLSILNKDVIAILCNKSKTKKRCIVPIST